MKRDPRRASAHRATRKPPGAGARTGALEGEVDEAMERFVRVLVRRGVTRWSIDRALQRAWRRIPRSAFEGGVSAQRELIDVSHVLTVWFGDPLYVDARGEPLKLPLHGAAPSLASLIQHVDPALEAEQVVRYLTRVDAVRRVGSRYVPRGRALALRGTGAPAHAHNLRGLLEMLRTLEHNIEPKRKAPTWFEYFAENPRFPVGGRERFDAWLGPEAMTFLRDVDSRMLSEERKGKPGEGTVRLGVGVYRFEEESPPTANAISKHCQRRLENR